jgi:hypothetical protein
MPPATGALDNSVHGFGSSAGIKVFLLLFLQKKKNLPPSLNSTPKATQPAARPFGSQRRSACPASARQPKG